jgi:hypothetical protein
MWPPERFFSGPEAIGSTVPGPLKNYLSKLVEEKQIETVY